jgi:hypothetical protein
MAPMAAVAPDGLETVLSLAERGWRLFPVAPRAKIPLVKDWRSLATSDPHTLQAWSLQHPDCNWGVACGAGSGVWVLDVDGANGKASLKDLVKQYGSLPARLTVRTGKGLHLYFAWPPMVELRNSAGKIGAGLDVRGEGGYVLAPGSIHPSGAIYVVVQDGPVAAAPEWLLQMAASPAPQTTEGTGNVGNSARIAPGGRHKRLAHIIGRMLKDHMTDAAILAGALAENATFNPPKSEADVRKLVVDLVGRYRSGESPADRGFELVTLGNLLAKGDTPVEYIWDGRLVAGTVSGAVAKPKVGKSTFARNLCLSVARGKDFLGLSTRQGECIYLALEERENEVRADFAALGADGREPILVHAAPTPAEGVCSLVELVRERKPRLVVIDPLFRLARVRDESAYAETYAALGPLIDVARETGTHLMLLHHSGKSMKADAIDAPLGSTAIGGAVCTLVVLRRTESYRTIQTVQRVGDDMPETVLQYDSTTHYLSLGDAKSDVDRQSSEARILEYLHDASEPQTQAQIRDAVEGQTKVIRGALTALVGAAKVVKTGEGTKGKPFLYKFPNSGSQYIVGTRKPESEKAAQRRMDTGEILVPGDSADLIVVPQRVADTQRERGEL